MLFINGLQGVRRPDKRIVIDVYGADGGLRYRGQLRTSRTHAGVLVEDEPSVVVDERHGNNVQDILRHYLHLGDLLVKAYNAQAKALAALEPAELERAVTNAPSALPAGLKEIPACGEPGVVPTVAAAGYVSSNRALYEIGAKAFGEGGLSFTDGTSSWIKDPESYYTKKELERLTTARQADPAKRKRPVFPWELCRTSCHNRSDRGWSITDERKELFDKVLETHDVKLILKDAYGKHMGDVWYSPEMVVRAHSDIEKDDFWLLPGYIVFSTEFSPPA